MLEIWAFIVILCCPFSQEILDPLSGLKRPVPHKITWEAPTQAACNSQRNALIAGIKGYTVRATVGDCLKLVEAPIVRP